MVKEKEIEVVSFMVAQYCRGVHKTKKGELCQDCAALLEYAKFRRNKCPHGDQKPFCSNCPIHCYKPDMREKMRAVMRYSGPRMIFSHPVLAIRHLTETKAEQKKMKSE